MTEEAPETTNTDRAARALVALRAYADLTGRTDELADPWALTSDFVADTLHLFDALGYQFTSCLHSAQRSYADEHDRVLNIPDIKEVTAAADALPTNQSRLQAIVNAVRDAIALYSSAPNSADDRIMVYTTPALYDTIDRAAS